MNHELNHRPGVYPDNRRPELPLAELTARSHLTKDAPAWQVVSLQQTAAHLHDFFRWGHPNMFDELETFLFESGANCRADELLEEMADAIWSVGGLGRGGREATPEVDVSSPTTGPNLGRIALEGVVHQYAIESGLRAATHLADFIRAGGKPLADALAGFLAETGAGQTVELLLEDVDDAAPFATSTTSENAI